MSANDRRGASHWRGAGRTLRNVRKVLVERRLTDISGRLHALREELSVIDEQFVQLADEADDTRLRSLMSETPLADREFRDAQRHATPCRAAEPTSSRPSSGSKPARTNCSTR